MAQPLPDFSSRHAQRGAVSLADILILLALALFTFGGVWWWMHRAPAQGGGAGTVATTSATAAPQGAGPSQSARPGGPGAGFGGFGNMAQPVSVAEARTQDMQVTLAALGNVAALNTALVRARVDGELKAIHFKEGQQVQAGALLAEIDPRSYQVALAQAQGQLARDEAQLRNALTDLKRYQGLLAKDSIAHQQVDTQAALVQQLQGTVQADRAQVDSAKLQLSYTRVTAPIGGRLGLKQADLGNLVHASDTTGIVSITQTRPISVVFSVPEANLPQITRKLKAGETLPVEAWDGEGKRRLAQGHVVSIDNAIDATTGTIKLKAEFANDDEALFPNQFVNVRLVVDTLPGALTVPTAAVQRGSQGIYVYAVKADNSVTVRRVKLGVTQGDRVSVEGELSPGERVVTDGADRLREGVKVEVIEPASSSASKASTAAAASSDPPWLSRLPAEMQAKVKAMNPEERQAFVAQMRERRRQQQ